MNVNIGHGNQRITEAVTKQMQQISFVQTGIVTATRGKLGKNLSEIAPRNLTKSYFTLGGSEAIKNGFKLARIYYGRHKIISHYKPYHDATYGALTVGGDLRKHSVDSKQIPKVVHAENSLFYSFPWGSKNIEECVEMAAAQLERITKYENPDSLAAILFEGESRTSGCIKYAPLYWKRVKAIIDKYSIVLIDDNTMSGFGRNGKWFAIDHHNAITDIICSAKGLTSKYIPLGKMIVSDKIADFFNGKPLSLGLTYSNHSVACAAALDNIKVLEEENMVTNAFTMGKYVEQKIEELKLKHPTIGDFRNRGLLGCIELVRNRETKQPLVSWNTKPSECDPSNRIAAKIRQLGMFTFVRWNWIFFATPLCVKNRRLMREWK
jgi:taurine--2-oxoglutarate transaminase